MYVCPLCGRVFKRIVNLSSHFRRVHIHGCTCPCCGWSASKHHGLVTHALNLMRRGDACHALLYLALSNGHGRSIVARRLANELIERRYARREE